MVSPLEKRIANPKLQPAISYAALERTFNGLKMKKIISSNLQENAILKEKPINERRLILIRKAAETKRLAVNQLNSSSNNHHLLKLSYISNFHL